MVPDTPNTENHVDLKDTCSVVASYEVSMGITGLMQIKINFIHQSLM
jgi:hypothetical protein